MSQIYVILLRQCSAKMPTCFFTTEYGSKNPKKIICLEWSHYGMKFQNFGGMTHIRHINRDFMKKKLEIKNYVQNCRINA